ncbi:hypothetical protein WN51_03307 [Melipona quadrifasciata]|uniref:Uncharacterized protein n=1 Tax=Melipona quadrifasciata TaxID=166423 RepID=A0A0M8ZWB3_9HYME|nr:hypothetical protein WN51_03307 [Melipona quadrifasciata]
MGMKDRGEYKKRVGAQLDTLAELQFFLLTSSKLVLFTRLERHKLITPAYSVIEL